MMGVRMPFLKQDDSAPPPPAPEDDEMMPPPPAPEDEDLEEPASPRGGQRMEYASGPMPIVTLPAFGSGIMPAAATTAAEENAKLWSDMLRAGGMFTKFKYAKGQKRMIWCPSSLDRILWGDEKKKKVRGYVMTCDVTAIRAGAEGSKKKDLALTIVSATRLLELEAMDSQQKKVWTDALQWLIGAAADK
jgi:hypothetical protein